MATYQLNPLIESLKFDNSTGIIKQCDYILFLMDNNDNINRGTLLHELLQLSNNFSLNIDISKKIQSLVSELAISSVNMNNDDKIILKNIRDYLIHIKRKKTIEKLKNKTKKNIKIFMSYLYLNPLLSLTENVKRRILKMTTTNGNHNLNHPLSKLIVNGIKSDSSKSKIQQLYQLYQPLTSNIDRVINNSGNIANSANSVTSKRKYLKALSLYTDIPFEVLRGRYNRGLRGDDLVDKKLPLSLISSYLDMPYNLLMSRIRKGKKGLDLISLPKSKLKQMSDEELKRHNISNIRKLRLYINRNDIPVKTLGRSIDSNSIRNDMANQLKDIKRQYGNKVALSWRDKKLKSIQGVIQDSDSNPVRLSL